MTDAEWHLHEIERARTRGLRAVSNLARTIRESCRACRTKLRHSGYIAPGGIPVSLTTCPRCDRKDDD
jgi:hypothetical protein